MECQINGNQVSKGLCFKSMIFCLQVLLYYIIVISRVNEISMHVIPYSDPSLCSLIVFYDYFDEGERGEERERERGRERENREVEGDKWRKRQREVCLYFYDTFSRERNEKDVVSSQLRHIN